MRAHKAHIRPGGLKGHGGLRTPCFSFEESSGAAPSYSSYTSYMSYRAVYWHVADVPGVQGERRGVALPPLPGRGAAPHTSNQLISQSAKILFVSFVSFVIEKYSGVLPAVAGP